VHSRFRLAERQKLGEILQSGPPPEGRIVVATQVVEAGVDIDARTMFTELAPWPSLVQRFGRCNRKGDFDQAEVYWLDLPDLRRHAAPYDEQPLLQARERLEKREGQSVGPANLPEYQDNTAHQAVLRRRDLVGLFDTTADLSGNYLDVSRFVRGNDDTDVSVFWREFDAEPPDDLPPPQPRELCNIRVDYISQYLSKRGRQVWRWDDLDEAWQPLQANDVRPGQTLLLRSKDGGYSESLGWYAEATGPVQEAYLKPTNAAPTEIDAVDRDPTSTSQKIWVTLQKHSLDVRDEARQILEALKLPELGEVEQAIITAAHYHDAGKAHDGFQKFLLSNLDAQELPVSEGNTKWAKRGSNKRPDFDVRPPCFRHEVASARGVLQHAPVSLQGWQRDLAAYLAMAHHGKARLALRSLPGKGDRNLEPDLLQGSRLPHHSDGKDQLLETELGNDVSVPATELDLTLAQIGISDNGEPSWLERTLGLRERLSPFRLAYLEALVRMADWRASDKEQKEANP
jgi:CRISPR-associated endonuclease/helicase Cas3